MKTDTPAPEADIVARLQAGASTSTSVTEHIDKYQALCDEAAATIRALRAEREPEGWRLVPVEPTYAMLRAGRSALLDDPTRRSSTLYRAMVAAAPPPPEATSDCRECREQSRATPPVTDAPVLDEAGLEAAYAATPGDKRDKNLIATVIRAYVDATTAGKPVAYRIAAPEDDYYGKGPDSLQFHPLSEHDQSMGYKQTPLHSADALDRLSRRVAELEGALWVERKAGDQNEASTDEWRARADEAKAQLDAALEVLEPFARVEEHDIGESESDADVFRPMSARNARAPLLTVGDFRRARAALGTTEGNLAVAEPHQAQEPTP